MNIDNILTLDDWYYAVYHYDKIFNNKQVETIKNFYQTREALKQYPELLEEYQKEFDIYNQQLTKEVTKTKPVKKLILEIRVGVGGQESSLFAGELYKIYEKYGLSKKWKFNILSCTQSSSGGVQSIQCEVKGNGIEVLKHEAGVHKVKRIPKTESKGRRHTSVVSVVVMESNNIKIELLDKDLLITTAKASGAGGQHVNTTDSAVQMKHIPTGITVCCQDQRNQIENRNKAKEILKIRLYARALQQKQAHESQIRKQNIQSGDRSDKMRTYTFYNNILTDHRTNKKYNLNSILSGKLDQLFDDLRIYSANNLLKQIKNHTYDL